MNTTQQEAFDRIFPDPSVKLVKDSYKEASELMREAEIGDSKHCQDCDFLAELGATMVNPAEKSCQCADPYQCPAVGAVFDEMNNLKEDEEVTQLALESVSLDIANYADAKNLPALFEVITDVLRIKRLEQAKDNELI